jgi:cytochrome c oxidase cbb3-type subunit 3
MNKHAVTSGLLLLVLFAACASCQRESRDFHPNAPEAEPVQVTPLTDYRAGGPASEIEKATTSELITKRPETYAENAPALSDGKRLYTQFNCYGCHAHGGGDMGPPLMDDRWIYGSSPEQIFSSIVAGRPNGMPAFGAKIPAYEVWQLAAYVRSMSGLASSDAAPGRDDHMQTTPAENSAEQTTPVTSSNTSVETQP